MNILVCGMRDSGKTDLCKAYCYADFDESEVEHEVKELGNKTIYTIEYLGYEVNFIDFKTTQDIFDFLQEPDMDIDAVMMTISVTDGPMHPTCELITACLEAGITNIVPMLTKCDLEYDPELWEIVSMECQEAFEEAGYCDMVGDLPEVYQISSNKALYNPGNSWWEIMDAALVTAMHSTL